MSLGVTVFDGASCIGGNKIYLDNEKGGIFLDFGKNFGKYSQYYEEFLNTRPTRGLHDLLHLGLIPRLNIYRQDLLTADCGLDIPPLPVSGVLLSHAHLDHCGNIGLLDASIPVVASPTSFAILKGYQDTGRSGTESDVLYFSERQPSADDPLFLESCTGPYSRRALFSTEKPSDSLQEFLSKKPGQDGKNAKKLGPGHCGSLEEQQLPFSVTAHEVDHSLYGACGFVIRGDGAIAYSGDFRLHGKNGVKSREFAEQARVAEILIIEGTRVQGDACGSTVSEESVQETCREAVETTRGIMIADFSARNFERLEAFKEIARRSGRELVVTARDLYMLYALSRVDGVERWRGLRVYDEIIDHRKRKWEEERVKPVAKDRYVTHTDIHRDPDRYIIAFSFFDMNHLLDIKPEGGKYLYSSCEPFNEEMEIDFRRLYSWLLFFGITPCGFTMYTNDRGISEPVMDPGYHASGHASGQDVAWMIDHIDPSVIIPVHTESRDWFTERWDQVVLVDEGKRYEF
ncbi:MAG: MBL fold metallo-hydrolase [Methanomicrobiales archaeon]|nr:MBL fold metallo-hydrolase [Methanomicrobiales archaeon]